MNTHFLRSYVLSTILVWTANVSQAAVIEWDVRWSNSEVHVCFAAPELKGLTAIDEQFGFLGRPRLAEWTNTQIQVVRDTINSSYTSEVTGIHFTGWASCTGTEPVSTVYLFSFEEPNFADGIATLGDHGKREFSEEDGVEISKYVRTQDPQNHASFGIRNSISRRQTFIYTILHEFGHLAGLRHEQVRQWAAQNDTHCDRQDLQFDEKIGRSALALWDYDPNSIMNYCYKTYLNNLGDQALPVLSDFDRRALKLMYP